MNNVNRKSIGLACLLVLLGFAGGVIAKGASDKTIAVSKTVTEVPVHKMSSTSGFLNANELIAPERWRVAFDPFWTPAVSPVPPMLLPSLVNFPLQSPKVQTVLSDKDVRVIVQIPGLNPKDVDVQVGKDALTIKGQKTEENRGKNKDFQAFSQSFEEAIQLPCKVDGAKAKATVQNGMLTVSVPKADKSVAQGTTRNWQ